MDQNVTERKKMLTKIQVQYIRDRSWGFIIVGWDAY